MLAFFAARAIPGVECVDSGVYHRTVRIDDTVGRISVTHTDEGPALKINVALSDSRNLMSVVARVRRMFDLDANMAAIHDVLCADPLLDKILRKHSGLRLPGAWDPFETAIRAVVGQQVSVKASRTVIGRIAQMAGPRSDTGGHPALRRFFPTAAALSACDLGDIGMPSRRAAAIKALAMAVASGEIALQVKDTLANFIKTLTRIPGIGDWTAQYIAMRALGEPDAFPCADLGIIKALQEGDCRPSPKRVRERAEAWRPWRAYAAICLWWG
jgi:3-methyladenine DNA glycosylase/8-oxoguanine DNA glycosylase